MVPCGGGWSAASFRSDVALLGRARSRLARRLILTAPLGVLDFSEVPIIIFRYTAAWTMLKPTGEAGKHTHPPH